MCTDNESDFSDYELQVDNARPHLTSNTANETLAKHSQPIQHHPQASKTPTLPERAPKPDIGHSAPAPRETKRSPCPSPKLVAKPHSQFLYEEKHIADYSHHKQSRSPAIQPVLGMAGLSSSIPPIHDTACADGNSRNKSTSQAVIEDTPIPVRVSSFRRPPQTAKLPQVCDATSITASAPSSEPLDLISIKDIKQEFNLSDDVTDESDYEVASDDRLPSIDVKKGTISNNETPSHQRDKVSLTQSTNEHDNTVQPSFPNPNHSDPIDDPLPSPVIRKQRKAHTREPKLIPQHAPKSVNDSPKASLHINQPTSRTPVSDTFNVSKPQQTLLSNVSKHKPSQTPSTTHKQEYKRKTNTDANTTPSKRTIPALKPSSGAIAESKSGIFMDSSKTFHRSISNEPSSFTTPPSLPLQFGTTTAKERNPAIGDAGSSNETIPLFENTRNSVSGYEMVHICGKDGCDFTARHLCGHNSHHVAPGSHWQRTNSSSCADQATSTKLPQHLGFQPRIIFPREHVHCEGCRFSFTHENCFHADTDDGQRLQVLPRVLKYCCKFCNLEIFFSAVPLSHLSIDIDHSCGFLKATSRGGVS